MTAAIWPIEVTFTLRQLPEGAEARNRVKLFETRGEYRRAGGSDFSAGFYQPKSRVFFAPFESIGLIPA